MSIQSFIDNFDKKESIKDLSPSDADNLLRELNQLIFDIKVDLVTLINEKISCEEKISTATGDELKHLKDRYKSLGEQVSDLKSKKTKIEYIISVVNTAR